MVAARMLLSIAALALSGCSVSLDLDQLSNGKTSGETCASGGGPGSCSSGIVIPWDELPKREIVGGFAEGNRLIVAVRVHGPLEQGAILSIDLETGHREMLAGVIDDVDLKQHIRGVPTLKDIRSVSRLQGGAWGVHLWSGFGFKGQFLAVDPASGKSGQQNQVGDNCPAVAGDTFHPDPMDSVVDSQGDAFLSVDGKAAHGVVRVTEIFCEPTDLPSPGPFLMASDDTALWYADAETAEVGRLPRGSSVAESVAAGKAGGLVRAIALTDTHVYLYRAPAGLEAVDRKDASRKLVNLSLSGGPEPNDPPNLFPHPDGKSLLLEADGRIFIVNATTGSSKLLSY